MVRNFDEVRDERARQDRTFIIGGETFTHRPAVAPEEILDWSDATSSAEVLDDRKWIELIDQTVMTMLIPDDRQKWQKVRDVTIDHPLNLGDLQEVMQFLIERMVNRPTGQPSDSPLTDGDTPTTSKAASSSPAGSRTKRSPSASSAT